MLVAKSSPDEIRYVGLSNLDSPRRRMMRHISNSIGAEKRSGHLHNWIRKILFDGDDVVCRVLEFGLDSEELRVREIFWIKHYREAGYDLCNMTDGGDGVVGSRHTPESKLKISLALRGVPKSKEHIEKVRVAKTGAHLSKEHIEKLRKANTGRKISDETRMKMSASQRARYARTPKEGYAHSEETRAKISASIKKRNTTN